MDIKNIRIIVLGVVLILALSLGGFYWYIQGKESSLEAVSGARGFGESAPSFSGTGGSTFENIVSGLGFQNKSGDAGTEPVKPPRLWQVLATPGSGTGFIAGATSTKLRFIERSTGYVFETDTLTGVTLRLTNTLIPMMHEARFRSDGTPLGEVLENGVRTTYTYEIRNSTSTLKQLSGKSLGTDIVTIRPHPKKNEVMTLVSDGAGSALIASAWDGSKPSRVFGSGLRAWNLHVLSDDSVIVAQPAASGIPGNAYRITATGPVPLVRNVPGLTLLPRANSGALLIGSDSGTVSLGSRGGAASTTVTLPIRTTAEKCVWAPGVRAIAYCAVPREISSSRYIDEWYRGMIHTNDTWWKVDAAAGSAELLFSPSSEVEMLDVEIPTINETGEYISFRNAYDKSIWVLRVTE